MPTLLIVDDELPQLRALSAIIRNMKPTYDIVACTDGEEAWETIQSRSVDALITDIRMPGMGGMELIRRVNQAYPRFHTILLSGYGQFEYAQEAIRCNVLEYVVKPIGQEAITRVLEKLEARWQEDQQRSASEALYTESLWQRLIEGRLDAERRAELQRTIEDGPGLALALDLGLSEPGALQATDELERRLKTIGRCKLIPPLTEDRMWIVLLWLSSYYAVRISEAWGKIQEMLDDAEGWTENRGVAGASKVHPRLFGNCEQACREAESALSRSFYEPHAVLLRYQTGTADATLVTCSVSFPVEQLTEAVRSGERRTLSEVFHGWLTKELAPPLPTPEQFKSRCRNGLLQVLNRLEEPLQKEDRQRLADEAVNRIAASRDWMELRSRASEWLECVADRLRQLNDDPKGMIVRRCQEYIKQHYQEDLSLERVSAMFNFNPSYFSSYFHMKTGTCFSDYLLSVRMAKARELLLTSSKRVEEIALEVGFSHSAYFIRMFKRENGVSPAAFRRLSGIR